MFFEKHTEKKTKQKMMKVEHQQLENEKGGISWDACYDPRHLAVA